MICTQNCDHRFGADRPRADPAPKDEPKCQTAGPIGAYGTVSIKHRLGKLKAGELSLTDFAFADFQVNPADRSVQIIQLTLLPAEGALEKTKDESHLYYSCDIPVYMRRRFIVCEAQPRDSAMR